jgi:hypothetical protein
MVAKITLLPETDALCVDPLAHIARQQTEVNTYLEFEPIPKPVALHEFAG